MTNHRRKMCATCAFRKTSVEMQIPERQDALLGECLHRVFWCHETMFQINPEESKWIGNFDASRKRNGEPAAMQDHQVCAGFVLLFGDEVRMDAAGIPVENHAILEPIDVNMGKAK